VDEAGAWGSTIEHILPGHYEALRFKSEKWPIWDAYRLEEYGPSVTPLCPLLIVCHLLNTVAISVVTSFSFQRFPDGERVALFSCVGLRQKD